MGSGGSRSTARRRSTPGPPPRARSQAGGHRRRRRFVRAGRARHRRRTASSGADLKAGFDPADDGMPDVRKELHELYHPVIAGVRRLEKPVVAAVNGPAVGIGASPRVRVLAAESAFFGLAFVNIGLMPDGGSTLFVPTAVGKARAFQMALLGERVSAERRSSGGSSTECSPTTSCSRARTSSSRRSAKGPTRSYASSKRALNQMLYPDLDGQLDLEPSFSTRSRARATSRRAWRLSSRSAIRPSRARDAADSNGGGSARAAGHRRSARRGVGHGRAGARHARSVRWPSGPGRSGRSRSAGWPSSAP